MDLAQIQNLMTLAAFALLAVAALGGAAVMAGEMRLRAPRRARFHRPYTNAAISERGSTLPKNASIRFSPPGI